MQKLGYDSWVVGVVGVVRVLWLFWEIYERVRCVLRTLTSYFVLLQPGGPPQFRSSYRAIYVPRITVPLVNHCLAHGIGESGNLMKILVSPRTRSSPRSYLRYRSLLKLKCSISTPRWKTDLYPVRRPMSHSLLTILNARSS